MCVYKVNDENNQEKNKAREREKEREKETRNAILTMISQFPLMKQI